MNENVEICGGGRDADFGDSADLMKYLNKTSNIVLSAEVKVRLWYSLLWVFMARF